MEILPVVELVALFFGCHFAILAIDSGMKGYTQKSESTAEAHGAARTTLLYAALSLGLLYFNPYLRGTKALRALAFCAAVTIPLNLSGRDVHEQVIVRYLAAATASAATVFALSLKVDAEARRDVGGLQGAAAPTLTQFAGMAAKVVSDLGAGGGGGAKQTSSSSSYSK